jgi:hypothetical protein
MLRDVIKPIISSVITDLLGSVSVLALFAAGEVGVWFEPNDITTLHQDIHALTPVTAPGQICALMLDKSKGLAQGPQLADVNTQTISQATGARSGAGWNLTATANFPTVAQPGTPITTGKLYRVSFAWSGNDELRTVAFNIGGVFIATLGATASGSVTRTVMATGTGTVQLYTSNAVAGDTLYLEITSVTEVQGNHAQQATAAQRPTYGVIPYGGVRNFAIGSGDVGNATYWPSNTVNGVTVTRIASGIDVDGLPYNDWTVSGTCTATSAINMYLRSQSRLPATIGSVWTSSVIVKRIAGSAQPFNCGVRAEAYGETAPSTTTEAYNGNLVDSATETVSTVTATLANAATNQAAATVSFRSEIGATLNATYRIKALQFEKGSVRTAFQLSMSKYNTTEAGKATVGALFPDGIDDGMVTPSIDFSGTDKMTVWAGVQKLSDAAQAVLLELSANSGTTPNSFSLQAPGPGVSFRLVSAGSATGSGIADATGFPAPTARVLTGIGDISGDRATLQVNGLQVAQSTADQGIGNYSNNPIYLFRRGGTTLPFNGIFTGLIARGAQSSAAQLKDGNTYLNSKLGAY